MVDRPRWNKLFGVCVVVAAGVLLLVASPLLLPTISAAGRLLLPLALCVGAMVLLLHPGLRRHVLLGEVDAFEWFHGVALATDVHLHPAHTWARREARRRVAVGADALMTRLLGQALGLRAPRRGQWVEQGEALFTLVGPRGVIKARAPVAGAVVEVNAEAVARPETICDAPYTDGWVVRLDPLVADATAWGLRSGPGASRWFESEVERLVAVVSPPGPLGPTALDGGDLAPDLAACLDDLSWHRARAALVDGAPDSVRAAR
jgi:glycine cleavage system H protein